MCLWIQQLRHESFVSTPHAERGGLSYLVSNLCLNAGFTPKQAPIQSRKVSQLQLVAADIGLCIVPEEFTEILPEQVRLVPLEAENSLSDVVMAWRKNADQVIQKSAEYLLQRLQRWSVQIIVGFNRLAWRKIFEWCKYSIAIRPTVLLNNLQCVALHL